MFLKVLPASQNSAEQDRGVDGRDFGIPHALAGVDVGEVIEESSMSRHLLPEKTQSGQSPVARVGERNVSAFFCDAQCGQAESGGRNTAYVGIIVGLNVASIFHQSSLRARLFPEILKVQLLQFIQELV